MTENVNQLLTAIPDSLREELLRTYNEITKNYREHRWEPSELNGGKLCEIVYSIVKGAIDGNFPHRATKPPNFLQACRDLEKSHSTASRSIRVQIPRLLTALYEVRNNRNVGHVGGDVDPNEMDATFVLNSAKWILAELIRVFHQSSPEAAARAVESLTEKTIPLIWTTGSTRRVLDSKLSYPAQTLALLYSSATALRVGELIRWTEYSNVTRYKNSILAKLHKDRLVEYDRKSEAVTITPLGIAWVEDKVLSVG